MDLLGIAWENILVGLLSGGVVTLAAVMRTRVSNYFIEKKFPLAGEYISKFEDEVNGTRVLSSAPVVLRQKGRNLFGTTSMPDDSRTWVLEGEVSQGGHIHGVYYAEDPHDRGIGNFFLYISPDRYMDGLWSGYDAVNKRISSGKYTFMPVAQGFAIKDLTKSLIPSVVDIADAELGKDYFSGNLEQYLPETGARVFRVATDRKQLLGFSYTFIQPRDEVIARLDLPRIPRVFQFVDELAVLKTIAVARGAKGRGIGTKLVADTIEHLRSSGVSLVCCVAWKTADGRINLGGIMDNFGFRRVDEIKDFWKQDSLEKNYSCPECGEPPCECSAVIYTKTLA